MEALRIEFEPFIDEATRHFIVEGLEHNNVARTGEAGWFPVNFVLRGEPGDVLGGLLGWVWGGWLHIDYLWIAEAARGTGHGRQLMKQAEAYAASRGATASTVETHSFQARPFYERLGYEVFGTLDGWPPGHQKFFLKKAL